MNDSRAQLTFWLSCIITGVWVISFFVDILVEGYEPPPSVHALMLLVAGALFGEGVFRRNTEAPPTTPKPQEEGSDA